MSTQPFHPTTKRSRCPVCNSPTGCLLADEGSTVAAICSRTESRHRCGKLGHLHLTRDDGPIWSRSRQAILKAARKLAEEATE